MEKHIMKNLIVRASALLLILFVVVVIFNNSNAAGNRETACPRTVTFCISGVGAGVPIAIYTGGKCEGSIVATIITGSDGCAQYTFTSGCDKIHSAVMAATNCTKPGRCNSFVPDYIDQVTVFNCNN